MSNIVFSTVVIGNQFKNFFKSLAGPLLSTDLSGATAIKGSTLDNFKELTDALEVIDLSIWESKKTIKEASNSAFGTTKAFDSFDRDLDQAMKLIKQSTEDYIEIVNTSEYSKSLLPENFLVLSASFSEKIEKQYKTIASISLAMASEIPVSESDRAKFIETQKEIAESVSEMKKFKKQIDREKKVLSYIDQRQTSGLGEVAKEVKGAISELKELSVSIWKGSLNSSSYHLGNLKSRLDSAIDRLQVRLEASRRIQRQSAGTQGPAKSALALILSGFASGILKITEGLSLLVKPLSLFFSVGVFGLAKLIFQAINSTNQFTKELVETRGLYQLRQDIRLSADTRMVEGQFLKRQNEFSALLEDTDYIANQNFNNIYNISEEQYAEINKITSGINEQRVREDIGKGISLQKAEFALVNDVIKFSYGLNTEYSEIAKSFDQMSNDLQYNYNAATSILSYVIKAANSGNISALRLFNYVRKLQNNFSSLNTRVAGTIRLVSLLQRSKAMSESAQDKFISDAQSLVSDPNTFLQMVSNEVISKSDFTAIFNYYKSSSIVTNRQADLLTIGRIDQALRGLAEGDPNAALELQSLIKLDPSLAFLTSLSIMRNVFLSQGVDIFKMNSDQLIEYANSNLRQAGRMLGVEYEQFTYQAILRLAEVKKRSKEKIKSFEDFMRFSQVDGKLEPSIQDAQSAEQQSKSLEESLVAQRFQIQNLFNAQRNFIKLFTTDIVDIIRKTFIYLKGAFAFLSEPSWEGWKYFTKYGSFDSPITLLERHRLANEQLRRLIEKAEDMPYNEDFKKEIEVKIKEISDLENRFLELPKLSDMRAYSLELKRQRVPVPQRFFTEGRALALSSSGTPVESFRPEANRNLAERMVKEREAAYKKHGKKAVEAALNANKTSAINDYEYRYLFLSILSRTGNIERASSILQSLLLSFAAPKRRSDLPIQYGSQIVDTELFKTIALSPKTINPLLSVLGREANPDARTAFIRGFFRAAARHPNEMPYLDLGKRTSDSSVLEFYKDLKTYSEQELPLFKRTTENKKALGDLIFSVTPKQQVITRAQLDSRNKSLMNVLKPESKFSLEKNDIYYKLPEHISSFPTIEAQLSTLFQKAKDSPKPGTRKILSAEIKFHKLNYFVHNQETGQLQKEDNLNKVKESIRKKSIRPTNDFISLMKQKGLM